MLHSEKLALYQGALSKELKTAIHQTKVYFKVPDLEVYALDEQNIALKVNLTVSIPSKGTVNGTDIRTQEPLLIKFNLAEYPEKAPHVMSDRTDFPKKFLSHLYYSPQGEPATLCLVRNSLDEWFASKKLEDLYLVAEQWFYKAAIGKLNIDGNEFDPTRLESYNGNHIYKYEILRDIVLNDERFIPELPMAILLSCNLNEKRLTYKSISAIPLIAVEKTKDLINQINHKARQEKTLAGPMLSILTWSDDDTLDQHYNTDLPRNFGSLKTFLAQKGIDILKVLSAYGKFDLQVKQGIPIIYAAKRPTKMIGYDGNLEFFNFTVLTPPSGIKKLKDDALVLFQSHLEPFSQELAKKLSGEQRSAATLYIGAGSLGSKMVLHDARTGKIEIGIVDNDTVLQHNLVRHALFQNSIGKNKAEALVEQIQQFYQLDSTKDLQAYPLQISKISEEEITKYKWAIDSTASQLVLNNLTKRTLKAGINITRVEIVDSGKLGLLYIEGEKRNPRIDDLVAFAYYKATKNKHLEAWRRSDAASEVNTLDIGLGCSSTTTVMPDDFISNHASVFSSLLAAESDRENIKEKGLIFLNSINGKGALMQASTAHYLIEKFDCLPCQAKSGWEVRFAAGVCEKVLKQCQKLAPNETGGILIGLCNYKTKTIHVFEATSQSKLSEGTPTSYRRNIDGLPQYVNQIKEQTGEVIGYVGEWHTHPMQLERLSGIDIETIRKLNKINIKIPIPTLSLVVTKDKILPFVFEN